MLGYVTGCSPTCEVIEYRHKGNGGDVEQFAVREQRASHSMATKEDMANQNGKEAYGCAVYAGQYRCRTKTS